MLDSLKGERIMSNAVSGVASFTTIQYEKNGEKLTATKNNGLVRITNEKGVTRQMPLREFLTTELSQIGPLEKSPEKDTVEISSKVADDKKAEAKPTEETTVSTAEVKKAEAAATPAAEEKTAEIGKKLNIAA